VCTYVLLKTMCGQPRPAGHSWGMQTSYCYWWCAVQSAVNSACSWSWLWAGAS